MEEKTYTQAQMEEIIKTRIAKVAQRASQAEERANALQEELKSSKGAQATIDLLTSQVEEYKGKLSTSERKFSRYQSISSQGLDPDMADDIDYCYEKSQNGKPKKDRVSLNDWLSSCIEDPQNAPKLLRPHLAALKPQEAQETQEATAPQATNQPTTQQAQRPQTQQIYSPNKGVQATPETSKLIERAMKDPAFYKANREAVQQAYRNQARSALRER